MTISGIQPPNIPAKVLKNVAEGTVLKPPKRAFAGEIHEKITLSLEATREDFLRMEAKELKKRNEFYSRFGGEIGEVGVADVEHLTKYIVQQLQELGRDVSLGS